MKNPTGIKLCISHQIKLPLPEDPLLKLTVLIKTVIGIIYDELINWPCRLTPLATITLFYSNHGPDPSKLRYGIFSWLLPLRATTIVSNTFLFKPRRNVANDRHMYTVNRERCQRHLAVKSRYGIFSWLFPRSQSTPFYLETVFLVVHRMAIAANSHAVQRSANSPRRTV